MNIQKHRAVNVYKEEGNGIRSYIVTMNGLTTLKDYKRVCARDYQIPLNKVYVKYVEKTTSQDASRSN